MLSTTMANKRSSKFSLILARLDKSIRIEKVLQLEMGEVEGEGEKNGATKNRDLFSEQQQSLSGH